ncbi:AMP-binding protein [Zavarzinia compransoris]|uniref:Acyl-CoA synthetase n=1 Tax=Zavarzinia compransoris TaxID=1264899 RepID=A0A317E1I3_9PROT|nr:AMP-binding protein [Zavarzinia compransoris]PWR20501.1 acyl-CoA synthetase [Zavarzinia compransoris]TDP43852.1 acyl-CoA synthetase (AMP-forming)/AMP-acid ligase II [Zavarzinia compransoris]
MHPGIHAANTPDKIAYRMAGSGIAVTYAELEARANACAHLFRSLGLVRGDSIALILENHPRFFEIAWAALRAGLYYTAISTRLTAAEAAYIVDDCGAKVLVTSRYMADLATRVAAQAPKLRHRLMLDGTAPDFAAYEAAVAEQPRTALADPSEGADMLYSSGTTGRPKGVKVALPEEPYGTPNKLFMLNAALYAPNAASVYLSPAPLYHAAPLRFSLTMMRFGATVIVMEHFEPEQYLALIEKYRVTHTQVVPTMFVRLLKLDPGLRAKYDLSSLQCAIHAAAPCPIPVKEQMIEWWGPVIHEYYAGTEGNGFCAITSAEWLAHKGSVGRAMLGVPHILDEEGRELPPGEPGAIYFSDGTVFEYHNDPDKTASSRNAAGWSTLGDIGYLDQEGYLYLTDRKANMIISGGVNIYPQEAENLLITHPKVADVAVFGVPDADWGEAVKAVVQPVDIRDAGPALEAELIAFCRAHLSPVKCPKTVDFEAELPRHPTGKLYKRLLKDRYWQGSARRIA